MGDSAYFYKLGPFLSAMTPMSGMTLTKYAAGTTTAKTAWTGRTKAATVSQPMDADVNGVVAFYGDGLYRLIVKNPAAVTLYDWDNVQIGPVQPIEVSAHKNGTDQTAVVTATWTKVTLGTEAYDAAGTFASDRWTPARVGRAAVYVGVKMSAIVSGALMNIAVYRNGASHASIQIQAESAISGVYGGAFSTMVDMTAVTDYIELFVQHNSGADAQVLGEQAFTWFQGSMVA